MVVNQKLLNSKLMKYNIWANVFNKLTWQQAQTPAQQPTNTPITQTRWTQGLQQQPETYKVITNKFPTYDIKDIMWFWPQAVKNQLWFANTVSQYNRLQAQADANTDPNVRYNLTKPELTNKQTLQIQQATPETNEQWLKINKTNSFKDLVIDLKNWADQWWSLSFVKFRELYPEYVENWDEVLDLYESIKANPAYTTEQITQNAQKKYPELFGIKDNLSDKDKTTALKKLYDEMVSNKQNWIQLTEQDIIDKYPEFANTEDINTVMEVQNLMNRDRKNTPTFNDIYENFESLTKWDVEVWNTEKEQFKKDLKSIDNIFQSTYNWLSDEWKDYVKLLSIAKAVWDTVRQEYWIPESISDRDILQQLKQSDPEYYNELVWDIDSNTTLSEQDRKLLDNNWTLKSAWQSLWRSIVAQWVDQVIQLWKWLLTKIENWELLKWNKVLNTNPLTWEEYENGDIFGYQKMINNNENLSKLSEKVDTAWKKFLWDLQTELWWMEEDFKNTEMYKKFESESWKKIKTAIKDWDWWAVANNMWWVIGQTLPALVVWYLTKWKWFTTQKLAEFSAFALPSYQRAMEDIESDESLSWLTSKEKDELATRMATIESVIETASLSNMFPWLSEWGGIISKIPWMKNVLLRTLVQTQIWAAWESLEEVTQEFFNNLLAKNAWSDRSMWEFKDYWDIFTETYLSSQLISALWWATEWINQAQINSLQKQITEQTDLRNKVLEWQAIIANDFNDFAQRVEVVPWTTTEELQQVWNNAQQKKQDLEQKANNITSNSYNNVTTPTYERANVKENEQPKLSAKDSQEYTDLLDEMEKNWEITKEDRKKVEMSLWVFTRNTEKTEQPQTEWLAEVAETPKTEKRTWWWTRKMSWLDNETITRIENNPYISSYWNNAVNMVEKEWLSMDNWKIIEQPMQELWEELLKRIEKAEKDLWEDGRMYRLIKNIQQTYDLSDSRKWIEWVLKNYDITTNEDWKLDFSNSQFIKAEDTNAISRAVELLNNTDLTNITPKQYWNLRKKLSSLSWFDKWTSKDWEAVVRQLRHLVDQLAKDNIPWLKKVDEIFSKELKYLEEIKQWLVYQQWERKWQIKDNFYSILKTINNQNRQQMNQRLEKIMPDLSDKVEAINMLPKLLKAYAVKSRLIEVWARNIWKVGWAVTGWIPWLVVWYVFDEITGKVSKNLRKNAINKIVNNMSDTARQRLEDIAAKQEEKETLTQEERETLNQVKAEIEKIIEQENNEQKPQTPSETEKKSEKKMDKAEQVQAKKKNNQNTKPKTKWLAKINETKEETKTEWLANTNKQEIRLWNESDYTHLNITNWKWDFWVTEEWDVEYKGNKIRYTVDENNKMWLEWYDFSNFVWKDLSWLLHIIAKLEERANELWLDSVNIEIKYWENNSKLDDLLSKDNAEWDDYVNMDEDEDRKAFVQEMDNLWFERKYGTNFEMSLDWHNYLNSDEHAGEQSLFDMSKAKEEYNEDQYYKNKYKQLDQTKMDEDIVKDMENEDKETDFRETAKNQMEAEKQGLAEISVKVENGKVVKESVEAQKPESNFVDFNDVDMSSKHESFWTDASDNSKQKNPNSAAWVTYYTASKMSDLDWLLRRYGGKWVNSMDFKASYTLWELLDNPALYKKYPWLENKLVIFADFHTNKKRWVNFVDAIYINSKIYEKNPWLARSTIVHEIEHEIQKYEWTYVEKSEAYQNSNRLWEDYVNDPNEQWAIKKQQEYLDFIGQGSTKIWWLDNTQIKKFAVQQWLAKISIPPTKEYTVENWKVHENF